MSFTSAGLPLRLVIGARAVSFLGDQVAVVAIMLRAQEHGASTGVVALLLIANLVPIALLAGPAGTLLDRVDNRRLITAAAATQAGACVALAFVSQVGSVMVGVAIVGAGQAVSGAGLQALIPSLAGTLGLPRALARSQAATTLAGVVAPGVSGLLVGVTGPGVPMSIDAATFAAVAVVGVLVGGLRPIAGRSAEQPHLVGGWRIIARNPVLATTLALLGLFCLLCSVANVVEVFLVRDSLHAGAVWFGLTGSAWAAGMFAGSLWAGRVSEPVGHARVLVVAAALDGLALVGMGVSPDVGWLLAAAAVGGVMNGAINVANSALLMGAAPAHERGRVSAVLNAVVGATQLGAYGLAAALTTAFDPRAVFVLAGIAGAGAPVLVGWWLVRQVSRHAATTDRSAVDLAAAA